jgi:hypothetical protein
MIKRNSLARKAISCKASTVLCSSLPTMVLLLMGMVRFTTPTLACQQQSSETTQSHAATQPNQQVNSEAGDGAKPEPLESAIL